MNEQKAINEQNKLEFTPQEIQKMMEDNFKKNDEIELLKTQIKNLEKEKNDLNIELNKYKEYLNSLNLPFNQFQLIPQNSPQQQNQNLIMNIVPNNDINDINNINNINNFNSNFQNNIINNNININTIEVQKELKKCNSNEYLFNSGIIKLIQCDEK